MGPAEASPPVVSYGGLNLIRTIAVRIAAQGDHAAAAQMFQENLDDHRRVFGERHPDTVLTMGHLAASLEELGDLEGALVLEREIYAARLEPLGREDQQTTISGKTVVNRLNDLGRTADAIAATQTLCWLLDADEASLTAGQRQIRDVIAKDCQWAQAGIVVRSMPSAGMPRT